MYLNEPNGENMKKISSEELDKKFDEGNEDILQYFDLENATRFYNKPIRINVDIPFWVVNALDKESQRIGVTRQFIIKMWLAERVESLQAQRQNIT